MEKKKIKLNKKDLQNLCVEITDFLSENELGTLSGGAIYTNMGGGENPGIIRYSPICVPPPYWLIYPQIKQPW